MITLSNAAATELLEFITDVDVDFSEATEIHYAELCKLLVLLSGEENHQSLMLIPIDPIEDETDETFDFVADSTCATGNCPVLMPPQLEQMG